MHSSIAVSGTGEPLGLLNQKCWNRKQAKGKRAQRKKKPIEKKESYRWLTTQKAAEKGLAGEVKMVHVGDREADIFELFAQERHPESERLIRLTHNRKVKQELGYLIPTIEQAPVIGEPQIQVKRRPERPERTAHLQVRAMEVTLEVPQNHLNTALKPVTLNVLLVEETVPPEDGGEPIRWLLATTLPIETFEQVWQCVYWYSLRWLIVGEAFPKGTVSLHPQEWLWR